MGRLFKGKQSRRVGVDFGLDQLRVVELEHRAGSAIITRFGKKNCEDPRDAGLLRSLLDESGIAGSAPATGFFSGGLHVILDKRRTLDLSSLSPEEQATAIRFDAERYLPYDIEEAHLSCRVLGEEEEGTLLAVDAVPQEDRERARQVLVRAGLEPEAYDTRLREAVGTLVEFAVEQPPEAFAALLVSGIITRSFALPRGIHLAGTHSGADGADVCKELIQRTVGYQKSKGHAVEKAYLLGGAAVAATAQAIVGELEIPTEAVEIPCEGDRILDPDCSLAAALALLSPVSGVAF